MNTVDPFSNEAINVNTTYKYFTKMESYFNNIFKKFHNNLFTDNTKFPSLYILLKFKFKVDSKTIFTDVLRDETNSPLKYTNFMNNEKLIPYISLLLSSARSFKLNSKNKIKKSHQIMFNAIYLYLKLNFICKNYEKINPKFSLEIAKDVENVHKILKDGFDSFSIIIPDEKKNMANVFRLIVTLFNDCFNDLDLDAMNNINNIKNIDDKIKQSKKDKFIHYAYFLNGGLIDLIISLLTENIVYNEKKEEIQPIIEDKKEIQPIIEAPKEIQPIIEDKKEIKPPIEAPKEIQPPIEAPKEIQPPGLIKKKKDLDQNKSVQMSRFSIGETVAPNSSSPLMTEKIQSPIEIKKIQPKSFTIPSPTTPFPLTTPMPLTSPIQPMPLTSPIQPISITTPIQPMPLATPILPFKNTLSGTMEQILSTYESNNNVQTNVIKNSNEIPKNSKLLLSIYINN